MRRLEPLATPVAGMGLTPGSDAFYLGGTGEVIAVGRLLAPALLASRFAGLATLGGGTVALTLDTAWVGNENGLTLLTLTRWGLTYHGPESPQVHDGEALDVREEDGEENGTRTRRKKMEESGYMAGKREENGMGYPTISHDPIDSIFRSPLTLVTPCMPFCVILGCLCRLSACAD